MTPESVREIADAVMYEGYMLYPYRPSSVKNRQRWTFGGLYPELYAARNGGASSFESQFLIESSETPRLDVVVRCLHLMQRADGVEEGIPREVPVGAFTFEAAERQSAITGVVELSTEPVSPGLYRATLRVKNLTAADDGLASMASTHAIATLENGTFVSVTDPPDAYRDAAAQCRNAGVWPVLAGDPATRSALLVSPIILYDFPEIAPESPGDLFDGTEIDEILTLRILTMTDEEKDEVRASDPRASRMLARTEALAPDQLMKLHGSLRRLSPIEEWSPTAEPAPLESVTVGNVQVKRGDRVRLWPQKTADIMDLALAGQIAEIESIEVDFEDAIHFAVILDNDPGRDLGAMRQPGHRFFFSPEEVEPIGAETSREAGPRVLVAGIGNVFLGDDAFGMEVVRHLTGRTWPQGVHIEDFGIRGLDLAYALMEDYEAVILIDALPGKQMPGTLSAIEIDMDSMEASQAASIEAHALDPLRVLETVKAMGGRPKRVLLIGCEPEPMREEELLEGRMGLSAAVEASLENAVAMTTEWIERLAPQPVGAEMKAGD